MEGKMKAVLKQLMIDFVGQPLPTPLPRHIDFPLLPASVKKAFVLIGMRRAGKTWGLYQEIHRLLGQGIPREQLIYINFEDDRLADFTPADWADFLPAYIEAFPSYSSHGCVFFLDEIHAAPGWEKFVLRLIDHENIKVYLSGSSAKLLSIEIATHLRGRTLSRDIFPMSFQEIAAIKDLRPSRNLTTAERARLLSLFDQYLNNGGFPETLEASAALRIELIQNYIENVVYRDVVERHEINNIKAVRQFIIHAIKSSGALLSINKMYQSFKSQGISVSKNALYDYARYFEDAYCLFFVPTFDFSQREQQTKPMKVYPVDPGVIMAYSIKPAFEIASTFETTVFLHLRRQHQTLFYYQTPSGKEVDFMVQTPQGEFMLYQASISLDDPKTKLREISALEEAMQVLGLKESYVITRDHSEEITVKSGVIHCKAFIDL
jgi:predicted AAA+ superfamily ATPase